MARISTADKIYEVIVHAGKTLKVLSMDLNAEPEEILKQINVIAGQMHRPLAIH